jgi:hypothetical protein
MAMSYRQSTHPKSALIYQMQKTPPLAQAEVGDFSAHYG